MTKYVKVLFLILLGLTSPVNLQDVIEASGEPEPNMPSTPYNLIDPESSGDGIGDVGNTGEKVDIIADHIPFDNETLTAIVNNGELGSRNESFLIGDLDTTTLSGEMPETSSAITGIQTTTLESTTSVTAGAPSTTTTEMPLETTHSETTTETTTTEQQTTLPTTASTTMRTTTTRSPATRRTTIPKTWKTTTKSTATSTVSSTTPTSQEVHACTFVEEDFVCDQEITCFGDGIIDCIDVEDEIEITTMDSEDHAAIDSEDYEEENAELFTDSGILTGRIHAIKSPSLLWKIHSMSTESSDSTTTVNMDTQSTAAVTVSSMTSKHTDPTVTASDTTAISDNRQMNTSTAEAGTNTYITTESSSTSMDMDIIDNAQNSENSDTTANPLQTTSSNMEEINGENVGRNSSVTEMSLKHTDMHPATPEKTTTLPGQQSARKKRSDDQKTQQKADFLRKSSSDSLHSSKPSKSTNVVKRCKIIGNIQCKPFPFTSFCSGRGTCKVPVEKTEKSTSEKKVESWAIIVIAICATAAALTVSLLIYLVVSSWKKLKVQPQNGVTTLTYVNSTPP